MFFKVSFRDSFKVLFRVSLELLLGFHLRVSFWDSFGVSLGH